MGLAAGESRRFTEGVMAISRSLTAWGADWLRGGEEKDITGKKGSGGADRLAKHWASAVENTILRVRKTQKWPEHTMKPNCLKFAVSTSSLVDTMVLFGGQP